MRGSPFCLLQCHVRANAPYFARRLSFVAAVAVLALGWSQAHATSGDLWNKWTVSGIAGAYASGYWGPVIDTPEDDQEYHPLYGIHAALLYDGSHAKLMLFRDEILTYNLDVADSLTLNLRGSAYPTPVPHQPMCGGYATIPDGRLLIVGGRFYDYYHPWTPITTGWVSLFDPAGAMHLPPGGAWEGLSDLPHASGDSSLCGHVFGTGRYYPTLTELATGKVLLTAGSFWTDCDHDTTIDVGESTDLDTWAIFNPSDSTWTLDSGASGGTFTRPWPDIMPLYPHMKLLPCGLFFAGKDNAYAGPSHPESSYVWAPSDDGGWNSTPVSKKLKGRNRGFGNCVVLTLDATQDKIPVLMVGGGDFDSHSNYGANGAEMITYHNNGSVYGTGWGQAGTMNSGDPRWNSNSVLLPNGQVLVIGGDEADPEFPDSVAAFPENWSCELFNPSDSSWTSMADLAVDRGHHSTALLIPDGRVVSASHEIEERTDLYQKNYCIFYPPYLFKSASPYWAHRDSITAHPDTVHYGLPFEITVADSGLHVSEVALMRPGAPTHGVDFSQRRVLLTHTVAPDNVHRLIISGPKDSTYAPPGDYMLFILDGGVPSEAKWVKVQGYGSYVVASGDSVRWGADVWLAQTFEVESGGKLTILPGTTVHANANHDVGILTEGRLVAEGTSLSPIRFTSTNGSGSAGEWDGLVFNLVGCNGPGYGYIGLPQPLSSVKNASIENATAGITVQNIGAPSLEGITFANIEANRDIYLTSDVMIPAGYWTGSCTTFIHAPGMWDLEGGTHVVASTTDFNDAAWIGTADKNDLIAYGKLLTDSTGAMGDSVFFGPDSITDITDPAAGNDWGGIIMTDLSAGSHLWWVDIGYAENPLFMFYPDSLTSVVHSTIHHFGDTGIWVEGTTGHGGLIDNCVVDRGSTLWRTLGSTGIFLDQADTMTVSNTVVDLVGREDASGATGIGIHYGKTFCETSASGHASLVIEKNTVVGPGRDVGTGSDYTGVLADWVCGSDYRDINIERNMVAGFKFAGMDFEETADVQNSCNVLWNNRRGVDVYRDSDPTGTSIRFKENKLEATKRDSTLFALRTADATHVKLGPSQSDRGHNRLKVNKDDTKFIFENDSVASDTLNARENFWYADTLLTSATPIQNRLRPTGYSISITGFGTDDSSIPSDCWPDTSLASSLLSGSSANHGLVAAGESDALAAPEPAAPTVLELGRPFPNPNRSGATLSLAVPESRIGQYVAQVFDVTGRRMWESRQAVPHAGRYRVVWEGRDSANLEVAAGVYFLRLSGPGGFIETRKITLLR